MAKSIVTDMECCLICGSPYTEEHHLYFGANRKNADKYGLTVRLCVEHHRGSHGVHHKKELDLALKKLGQRAFEKKIGSREEFMAIFGRNYL